MRRRVFLLMVDVVVLMLAVVAAARFEEPPPVEAPPVVQEEPESPEPTGDGETPTAEATPPPVPVPEAYARRGMGHPVEGDPREAAAGAVEAIQEAAGGPLPWVVNEVCEVGPEGELVSARLWTLRASFFVSLEAVDELSQQLGLEVRADGVGPTTRRGSPGAGGIVEITGDDTTSVVTGSVEFPLTRPEAAPGVQRIVACGQPAG